jgi:methylthioribose-1-phosphate isomerase
MVKTLYWKNRKLFVLDQRLLPRQVRYIVCRGYAAAARAIKDMAIRGAPAIGVAAAFGVALAVREKRFGSLPELQRYVERATSTLAATRPTAVNLFWALERMRKVLRSGGATVAAAAAALENEAIAIYHEDIAINCRIGELGEKLFRKKSTVLTHCNAGALATAGYGTALGVLRSAHRHKKIKLVYVDETRPYLQGARLTAWEMKQEKIPYVLVTDNMAGHFMKSGEINAVIVGADRIAANGDTANKIGTYSLAVLAQHHKIPFYVAAPTSTVDLKTPSGERIVIEERSSKEVLEIHGKPIAPRGTIARHPAFDVTPARYITAIITEKGVFKPRAIAKSIAAE